MKYILFTLLFTFLLNVKDCTGQELVLDEETLDIEFQRQFGKFNKIYILNNEITYIEIEIRKGILHLMQLKGEHTHEFYNELRATLNSMNIITENPERVSYIIVRQNMDEKKPDLSEFCNKYKVSIETPTLFLYYGNLKK